LVKRKYIGGKVKVYDNVDSDCFYVPEVKHYCAKLGVSDYVQFYFVVLGLDLHNDLRYLSNDANTQELFKCHDPIDLKIDIYVEHATPVQKKIVNPYISVVDSSNLVGYGVGVEDVDVDVDDFDDDNDVDLEDGDEALADDEFEEDGNLVDEGNDAGGHDGNGDVGDVTYDWYNTDYDDLARHGKWVGQVGFGLGQLGYKSIGLQGQKWVILSG